MLSLKLNLNAFLNLISVSATRISSSEQRLEVGLRRRYRNSMLLPINREISAFEPPDNRPVKNYDQIPAIVLTGYENDKYIAPLLK